MRAYLFDVAATSRTAYGSTLNHSLTLATTTAERAIELARGKWGLDNLVIMSVRRRHSELVYLDPNAGDIQAPTPSEDA